MGLSVGERKILQELRAITGRKLKVSDLLEWSTSEAAVKKNLREGEVLVHCPGLGVWCAVAEHLGRSWVGTELNEEYAALARERIAAGYHPKETSKARRAKRVMRQLQGLLFE